MKEKLVVIVGPTAVGKSKLGIELAKAFHGEVISGDSMQVYKKMNIGTAKVTKAEMDGVKHHLIDILEPTESFSVATFQSLVKPLISKINERGHIPFLVGGTGLYVNSVIYDYQFADISEDHQYRDQLEQYKSEHGVIKLHEKLKEIDPISYKQIHPNNYRRVIRALEVYHVTKKTIHEMQNSQIETPTYDHTIIGLTMDRHLLYERINARVDKMIEDGLVEEATALYHKGITDCQSVQAIGYKEIYEYIEGKSTLEEAIEQLKQNSRRYAKRQLTWFRNKMDAHWFEVNEDNFFEKYKEIAKFLKERL